MPLGASITYGLKSSDGNGYRKALRDQIVAYGNDVNMVGSRRNGSMEDNDVEGWPGYVIDQVQAKANVAVSKVSIPFPRASFVSTLGRTFWEQTSPGLTKWAMSSLPTAHIRIILHKHSRSPEVPDTSFWKTQC
jgi:hypothetical protein